MTDNAICAIFIVCVLAGLLAIHITSAIFEDRQAQRDHEAAMKRQDEDE